MTQRRLFFTSYLIVLAIIWGPQARGQSFLDKLEKTVREQLSQPQNPPVQSSEELPAPKADGGTSPPVGQANTQRPASPLGPPIGTPAPVPALNGAQPPAAEPGGSIYLGIEVEAPIGSGIGVRIASVEDKSPAKKGDLRVGDRILAINGFAIANIDSMVTQLNKTRPGQTVKFLVMRSGRNLERRAVLMDAELAARIQNSRPASTAKAWLGVQVNDLTDSFRRRFGLAVYSGAAIVEVTPGSPAAKASIRPGEVIADVNGTPIERASTLMRWVKSARPGERAELLIYKGGKSRIVEIVLEADPESISNQTKPLFPSASSVPAAPVPSVTSVDPAPTIAQTQESGPLVPAASPLQMRPSLPAEKPVDLNPHEDSSTEPSQAGELARLRDENSKLRQELTQTQDKLNKLQRRIDTILQQLQLDKDN